MASITVRDTEYTAETTAARSVLIALQKAGVPIETLCGGRAMCGRCAVRIIRGNKYLSQQRQRETDRLRAIGAESNVRLACQTYTRGDIEIEIINTPTSD
jgi:adenylate cyclase